MHLVYRILELSDAAEVARISAELDYPTTAADISRRFVELVGRSDSGLYVAEDQQEAKILAWVHVYGVRLLETDGYAEIGGIVVTGYARRKGIGRSLCRMCEEWAASHGYQEVRLRSGLQRGDAHEFYQRVGYERTRASYMFRKRVISQPL